MFELMTALTKRVGSLATSMVVTAAVLFATAPVPRKSLEFTFVEPSGKQTSISSFQGKVVVMEFLLINCPHCTRVAQMISKLHKELGPRGFQPIGIAFDDDVGGGKVTEFVRRLGITYPVGYTSSVAVDEYLGRKPAERFMVPQIVVIDRQGIIRAQSRPVRESSLEDEIYLRNLLDSLLKESAPATNKSQGSPPSKKTLPSTGRSSARQQ
jgi:peroxiredoxin